MISLKRMLAYLMVIMGLFLSAAAIYQFSHTELQLIAVLVLVDAIIFFIGAYWIWTQRRGYYIGGMLFLLANIAASVTDQLGLIDFVVILLLLATASLLFLYNQKETVKK